MYDFFRVCTRRVKHEDPLKPEDAYTVDSKHIYGWCVRSQETSTVYDSLTWGTWGTWEPGEPRKPGGLPLGARYTTATSSRVVVHPPPTH